MWSNKYAPILGQGVESLFGRILIWLRYSNCGIGYITAEFDTCNSVIFIVVIFKNVQFWLVWNVGYSWVNIRCPWWYVYGHLPIAHWGQRNKSWLCTRIRPNPSPSLRKAVFPELKMTVKLCEIKSPHLTGLPGPRGQTFSWGGRAETSSWWVRRPSRGAPNPTHYPSDFPKTNPRQNPSWTAWGWFWWWNKQW